jgi:serine/threonine protein phosphatase 1
LWWGSPGFGQWSAPYESYTLVVRGYDHAHGGSSRAAFSLTIDGGCGFGGKLAAVCLAPDGAALDWIET